MRPAPVLVAVTVVGLLAGCSGGGDEPVGARSSVSATPTPTPTPLPSITARADDPTDAATQPGESGTDAVAGDEHQYAIINAAKNSFEGAIVEAGQAVCDRVAFVAQIDQGQLQAALTNGELATAGTAIPLLCPEFVPQLVEAHQGFADGTVTVASSFDAGSTVPAGRYSAPAPSASCSWKVVGADGATLDEGKASAKVVAKGRSVTMTISPEASTVTSTGCRAWVPVPSA